MNKPKGDYEDPFAPPLHNPIVECLHCGRTYHAFEMKFEVREGTSASLWYCKYSDCDGAGFGWDIFTHKKDLKK